MQFEEQLNRRVRMEIIKNYKAEDYRDMVADLLQSCIAVGCNMSLKLRS